MITAKLGLQQRILPSYRVPFFDLLATECRQGLGLFAGQPLPSETIDQSVLPQNAVLTAAQNIHVFKGSYYFCWQKGFCSWLNKWQPEVLIVEANPRYLSTPLAVRWMKSKKRPIIGWGLGAPNGLKNNLIKKCWQKLFFFQFDALLAYSQQGALEYQKMGFPENRIFVAANAVAPRPAKPFIQKPLKFSKDGPVLLFVGRLQHRKRVDLLIRACAKLSEEYKLRLWIVGDGPASSALKSLAQNIFPTAEFFGQLHGTALDSLFEQADLFVLPGTGGLAIQQAMSFGLPVIVGEADGTQSDLVRPGNGWIIPPGNLDDLIHAILNAIKSPSRLREMGLLSFQIVDQEINLEKMASSFVNAVNFVIERQ